LKHLLLISLFIYAGSSWSENLCHSDKKLSGSYFSDRGKGYIPSKVVFTRKKSDKTKYHFDLESYWSARAYDDGSSTTQAIYSGDLEVNACSAVYYSDEDDCLLRFEFNNNKITISHTGHCSYIGYNASPDGVYFKNSNSSFKRDALKRAP
jgi:hypothetical protein